MRALLTIALVAISASTASAVGVCLGPSSFGNFGTIDCATIPQLWPSHVVGYSQLDAPCDIGFCGGFDPIAGDNDYGWTISSSTTDPYANSGALPVGVVTLYLWYECNSLDGIMAAEFGLQNDDPSLTLVGVTTVNGFLSGGTLLTDLLIAVGGCPSAPIVAAQLLFVNSGPVSAESESWSSVKSLYR